MDGYGPDTYGDGYADVYDEWYSDVSDVDATVAGVIKLAGGGAVLELGTGTGRLALPLAAAGVEVVGIDASKAMLARLAVKPGADAVMAVEGDMAELPLRSGHFAVAFAAFNTFFNLTAEGAQKRCVAQVRDSLRADGAFAIEAFAPPTDGLNDSGVSVKKVTVDSAVLSVSSHDAATQSIQGQHIEISEAGIRMRPWMLRYRTPAQLDELLISEGFSLESRHADWAGAPFDDKAATHVSIYRRVG